MSPLQFHFRNNSHNLEVYFPTASLADQTSLVCVKNPFVVSTPSMLTGSQNEHLVDFQECSHLKESFANEPQVEFWA